MDEKPVKSYNLPYDKSSFTEPSVSSTVASTDDLVSSNDGVADRGNWGNPIEFVLSCMNYALGLGNVWRFPYLCFRNGGGAFLVPYFLMVFIVGLPLFFAELVIGQYSGLGPIKAFSYIAPLFKGLGYCSLITTCFVAVYYMVIIAWVLFYLWTSFFPSLIWGSCDNDWNSDSCFSIKADIECQINNVGNALDRIFFQRECRAIGEICAQNGLVGRNANFCFNETASQEVAVNQVITRKLAAEEFYYERVLGLGSATWTEGYGYPQGHLVLCLAIAWIMAFFCVFQGVKSVGKIVYFTATFPYLVLTALLIRALTLEGSIDGIMFFITPQWERLQSPGVWGDASSQVFFSFSLGWGALIILASFNKFTNNCHFDATFVSLVNFGTALYNGFVVFGILGFLAHSMNVPIEVVTSSGPGLTFITYPEAVLLMPLPQLWAIIFFFMMLILGLGSQFGSVQMIVTSIIDQWPHLREHQWRVTAGTCIACFVAALPMTCNGGIYLKTLIEWHTASWNIFLIGFAEVIILAWIYGINRTLDNVSEMGMKLMGVTKIYWKSVWVVITPVTLIAIFVFILTDLSATVFGDYVFPVAFDVLGYLFGLATLVPFVVFAIIQVVKTDDYTSLLRPTKQWGPQEVDGRRVDRAQMSD